MINPEFGAKRCSSSLELDAKASDIINIIYTDVKCNPGLKAIREEQKQHRYQAGKFTPSQASDESVRCVQKPPQTVKWEEKLSDIIKSSESSFDIEGSQLEALQLLLELNTSQRNNSPKAKFSVSSQEAKINAGVNLSINCDHVSESDMSENDEDQQTSIMMSQKLFYGDGNAGQCQSMATDLPQCDTKEEPDTDDYFDDCTISDTQLLQLDGNSELPTTKRKRRRLGSRPQLKRNVAGSSGVNEMNSNNMIAKRTQVCSKGKKVEQFKNPKPAVFQDSGKRTVRKTPKKINVTTPCHISPEVIKLSPHASPPESFDLSKFDDLLNSSPKGSKQSAKYCELSIISPKSEKLTRPRRSLSLKRSDRGMSPCSTKKDSTVRKRQDRCIKPRNLFESTPVIKPSEMKTRENILKTAKKLYENDILLIPSNESISSDTSGQKSESELISEGTSSIPANKAPVSGSSQSTQLSEEFRKIEENQKNLKDKVLQWLSESECSQDETEIKDTKSPEKRSVANESFVKESSKQINVLDLHSKVSTDESHSLSVLESISYSPLECKPGVHSIEQISGQLKDLSESSSKEDFSKSDTKSVSLFSPITPLKVKESPRSPALFSPNEAPNNIPQSPIVHSVSDELSITSTPKMELDSSLFFSQFNLSVSQQTVSSSGSQSQTLKYAMKPPTYGDSIKYIEDHFDLVYSDTHSCYSAPNTGKSKDYFCPETDVELDIIGLDGWTELSDSESPTSVSKTLTMSFKYSVPPPSLRDTQVWLNSKSKLKSLPKSPKTAGVSKKRELNSIPDMSSTPLTSKVKFNSFPIKLTNFTPIASRTPLTKFKNEIFSPRMSTKTPISPTLYINSQISHLSNNNSFKFALTVPMGDSTRSHVVQHLTIMSLECFANSVARKRSDPRYDSVYAIFYCLYSDDDNNTDYIDGVICVEPSNFPKTYPKCVTFVKTELELFQKFFTVINIIDPDILVGYEIRNQSVGYLIERASSIGLDFQSRISRFPEAKVDDPGQIGEAPSNWWVTVTNEVQLSGRIIINLWRLMKTEVNLTNYSFENISYHVLHERVPKFENQSLIRYYQTPKNFGTFVEYFAFRSKSNLRLLLDLNMVVRTSEMARLFGIEFFNVLSRGSQYRVESMMTRLAKPLGFVSISPSPDQRKTMAAPEYIPLVMEPESKLYTDPVVVLDFQSLYPSMIIAYNLCFSTCLGRVNYLGGYSEFPFGCSNLKVLPETLKKYQDSMFVSPNGVAFVDKSVRHGVLPLMLSEILETRIQVKDMMKQFKDDKALYRMLDARQLALKLIANVTYGYTSANFSGRMPCIEIGDTIVAKGRETLESTIEIINTTPKWGGRVVYGDTDSVFILFKGCTREQAFKRGKEIAVYITSLHPRPVKLKFEKVYQPCVLQTKKRYVGMKYESEDDPGEYEAKGIETVRRDGCPASVKTLKQSLKILFSTLDVDKVKLYVQNQFMKIIKSQIPLHDYIFAKEYRGMDGYRPTACVPALEIAKKRLKADPRSEPLVGERVAYMICYGVPGLPLIQLIHEPYEILASNSLKINSIYYITKAIIPALQRVFSLLGLNVMSWYHELPQDLRSYQAHIGGASSAKHTIVHYYHTKHCPFCDGVSESLCLCYKDTQKIAVLIHSRLSVLKSQVHAINMICGDCSSITDVDSEGSFENHCVSLACPVFYKKARLKGNVKDVQRTQNETKSILNW